MAVKQTAAATVAAPVRPQQRRVDIPGSSEGIDLNTMGGRISWARLRREMTQNDLSKAAGKSRATVVQYEQNNIEPPLEVIRNMAEVLHVAPEFIAFGRHGGLDGTANAAVEIVPIKQIRVGRDGGLFEVGNFAVPREIFEGKDINPEKVHMVALDHDEPAFAYHAHDRLLVDTSIKEITSGYEQYLLKGDIGVTVVRREPNFVGGQKGTVLLSTGTGTSQQVKTRDLDIVGAVVGKFSLSA